MAFRVEAPRALAREEVLEALHALPEPLWLVDFDHPKGLARCTHLRKDATIDELRSLTSIGGVAVRVATLGTSGTIRAATRRYLA